MKLLHKVALVTGGSRGIGRSIALAFAREGAKVCIAARDPDRLRTTAEEIHALGEQELAVACDVTSPEDVARMVDRTLTRFGRIDVLVNNAGGTHCRGHVAGSDPAAWKETLLLNLLGAYHCCREVLPAMTASGGGKIINIGSGAGVAARAGNSAYDAAKAALHHFTRTLALEVWQQGVDVNELVPGPVETDLTHEVFTPGGMTPPLADSERLKQPEEVAELALFLAAYPPGGPTGQTFSLARRPL